jgi:predicted NBD/HSP70 family sugar kinase/biotin operon repressor
MRKRRAEPSDITKMRALVDMVEKGERLSRAGIAKNLGVSRTTVSTLVSRLINTGILKETGTEVDGRGRPGISLDIATEKWFSVGAEYHSRQWVFVITDLKGSIYKETTLPILRADPEDFLEGLGRGLKAIMRDVPGRLLPAAGIGTPGLADCNSGRIIQADDLGWKEVRVSEYLQRTVGISSYIINRHRAGGLAEARFGAGREVHSFIYIGIGTGISAAILSEGVLLHGTTYSAGEIGHITMDTQGPECRCGRRGCLHTLASGTAMGKRAFELLQKGAQSSLAGFAASPQELSGEIVAAEAARGDAVALKCLGEAAAWLGIAVANLITTFNPDKILIGGPIGAMEGPFIGMIRKEAARWAMQYPFAAATVERGALGEDTGALGAACLILDRKMDLILAEKTVPV